MDRTNDWRVDSYQGCSGYSSACTVLGGSLLKSSVTTYTGVPSYTNEILGTMRTGMLSHTPATTRTYLYPYGATIQSTPLFASGKDYGYVSSGGYSTTFYNWMTNSYLGCLGVGATSTCANVLTGGPSVENMTVGFNQLQSTTEYDWGSGISVGAALRTTESHFAWQDRPDFVPKGLIDHVSKQYVWDGSTTVGASSAAPVDETDSVFDGNGNLLSTTRNGMQLATYAYRDTDGMLKQTTDSAGNATMHAYDSDCNGTSPMSTTTPSGLAVSGKYDSNCMALELFTDANGQTSNYLYDGLGRISKATYPDGGFVKFDYDDTNLTVKKNQSIADSRLSTLEVKFDGLGREIRRATSLDDTNWRESDIAYDNRGRKRTVSYPYLTTSPLASTNTTGDTYDYDALSRVTKVTHSDNSAVNSYYTARSVRVVDENNHARVSQSDALGRMINVCEVTSATMRGVAPSACGQDDNQTGFVTNYGYDVLGNLTSVAQGAQTRSFTYDSVLHRLLTTNNPESGTITYSYSTSGSMCSGDPSQPCSKTDARGYTTKYAYDNEHRLISKYYYTPNGNADSSTPTSCYQYGLTSDSSFFTGGRLINSWTQSGSCAAQNTYTSSTQPSLTAIGSTGSAVITQNTVSAYDPMGRVLSASQQNIYGDSTPHTLSYQYDLSGRLMATNDGIANGFDYTYSYDLAGELTAAYSSLAGAQPMPLLTNASYAAAGLKNATLGNGLLIARQYDARNRLHVETDTGNYYSSATPATAEVLLTGAEQNSSSNTYAKAKITISGSLKSLTSGSTKIYDSGLATVTVNGESIRYAWNCTSGNVFKIARGLASSINAASHYVTASVNGSTLTLTSKSKGSSYNYPLSVSTTYSSSFEEPSFLFTASGSTLSGGTGSDSSSSYDTGSVALTVGGITETVSFGQGDSPATIATRLSQLFSSAKPASFSVTSSGAALMMRAKTAGAAGNSISYSFAFTHNSGFTANSFGVNSSSGSLSGGADANTASGATVYSYNVSYADNSNVSSMTDSVMGSWSYGYDDLNRLTSATATDGRGLSWTYDRYGNGSQSGTLQHQLAYNPANNQILTASNNISYDASGNVTGYTDGQKGGLGYVYDAESRIYQVYQGGSLTAQYVYDASGARVAKLNAAGAATAVYVLGGGGQLDELDGSGNVVHRNVYAGGSLIGTYDAANNLHLHLNDWLGTRRAQTDANGTLQLTFASYPFGDGLTQQAGDATENHFTGKERDNESGLDYFGARYLASSMGRFMSPDPIGIMKQKFVDPQQWNMYSYVRNNPLKLTDPTGKWVCNGTAQQCQAFETSLNRLIANGGDKGKTAAQQYGKKGDKRVQVGFGSLQWPDKTRSSAAAITQMAKGADGKPNGGINVTFDEKIVADASSQQTKNYENENNANNKEYGYLGLDAVVAHEGVHVAIDTLALGMYFLTGAKAQISKGYAEDKAYETEDSVLGQPSPYGLGNNAAADGFHTPEQRKSFIDQNYTNTTETIWEE